MAWVTKDSKEEYQKPQEAAYTKQEKAGNWWHYNKVIVLVVVVAAVIAVLMIHDIMFQTKPDLQVAWVGSTQLTDSVSSAIEQKLQSQCPDLNGDGKVIVELNQYVLTWADETAETGDSTAATSETGSTTDAYTQMAGITRLSGDLSTKNNSVIFFVEDPAAFQKETQVLEYLDGTQPAESASDWQNMCLKWENCPALSALDASFDEELSLVTPSQIYVARRILREDTDADLAAASDSIWKSLTAGAVQ
jgi:hypothetical protein